MIQHMHTHKIKVPYNCNQCDMTFTIKEDMISHISTHTSENLDPSISVKSDLNKMEVNKDISIQISAKPHQCKFCDRTFIKYGNLQGHEYVHTGEKPFECIPCNEA